MLSLWNDLGYSCILKMDKKRVTALIGFPLLIFALLAGSFFFKGNVLSFFTSADLFKARILAAGWIGPFLFVGLQFLQVILFVIPGEIPQIAGGFLFGILGGTALSLLGITAGTAVNFILGRVLGRPFVEAVLGKERTDRFEGMIGSERAQTGFFLLFLIPGIPKDALCYVAGLSKIGFLPFLLISSLGRFPALLGSSVIGSAVAAKNWTLLFSVSAVVVVIVGLGFLYRGKINDWIHRFHRP